MAKGDYFETNMMFKTVRIAFYGVILMKMKGCNRLGAPTLQHY